MIYRRIEITENDRPTLQRIVSNIENRPKKRIENNLMLKYKKKK